MSETADDAQRLFAALALPPAAIVDRRVAKSLLVERGALGAADRRAAEAGIERLTWRATLHPASVGIAAHADEARDYAQLVVMAVELRRAAGAARLAAVIHRAIAHPLLLICHGPGGVVLSAGLKRRHEREAGRAVVDRIVTSPAIAACPQPLAAAFLASLPLAALPAADLWGVHLAWADRIEALAASLLTGTFRPPRDAAEAADRRAALTAHAQARAALTRLRRQAAAERRMGARIDLANAATHAADTLAELTARLA